MRRPSRAWLRAWWHPTPRMPNTREYLSYPRPLRRWMWAKARWTMLCAAIWYPAWTVFEALAADGWLRVLFVGFFVGIEIVTLWQLWGWVKFYRAREKARADWEEFEARLRRTARDAGVPLAAADQLVAHILDDDLPGAARLALDALPPREES